MPSEPWTQTEVAAYIRADVKTVQRLRPPCVRLVVSGSVRPLLRYDADEIRAWWAALVVAAQAARASEPLPAVAPAPRPTTRRRSRGSALRLEVG